MIVNMNTQPGQIPSAPPDRKKPAAGNKPKAETVKPRRDSVQIGSSNHSEIPLVDPSRTSLNRISAASASTEFMNSVKRPIPKAIPGPSLNASRPT